MKKSNEMILVVALLVASFVVPNLRAQDNPDRPEGAPPAAARREQVRDHMMMMAKELGLTEDQKAQMKQIMMKSAEEGKAIRDDASLSREQKMEKGAALRKSTEEKIDAILTPEQIAKRQELRAAHGGGPKGDMPARKKKKAE